MHHLRHKSRHVAQRYHIELEYHFKVENGGILRVEVRFCHLQVTVTRQATLTSRQLYNRSRSHSHLAESLRRNLAYCLRRYLWQTLRHLKGWPSTVQKTKP